MEEDKIISRVILKFKIETKDNKQEGVFDFTKAISEHIKKLKTPDGVKVFELVGLEYDWSEKIFPKTEVEKSRQYTMQDLKSDFEAQDTWKKVKSKKSDEEPEGKEFIKTDVGEWLK